MTLPFDSQPHYATPVHNFRGAVTMVNERFLQKKTFYNGQLWNMGVWKWPKLWTKVLKGTPLCHSASNEPSS